MAKKRFIIAIDVEEEHVSRVQFLVNEFYNSCSFVLKVEDPEWEWDVQIVDAVEEYPDPPTTVGG